MSYSLCFEIHELPRMANGSHGHWRADAAKKKHWFHLVSKAVSLTGPPEPLEKAEATLTRCSASEPDYDGLVHGFKPIVDSLRKLDVIQDDRPSCFKAEYFWEKAPRGKGKIRVEVREVPHG